MAKPPYFPSKKSDVFDFRNLYSLLGASFLHVRCTVVLWKRCHVIRFDVCGSQRLCKGVADKVLELLSVACASDALVHDGKCQLVAVGSHGIAGKGTDPLDSSGFCPNTVLCTLSVASSSERTVLSHYGQCGQKRGVKVAVVPGSAQDSNEDFGRRIVIERQSAAVGNLEVLCLRKRPPDKGCNGVGGLLTPCKGFAAVCGKMVEDDFCYEVVAAFEHGLQHLL